MLASRPFGIQIPTQFHGFPRIWETPPKNQCQNCGFLMRFSSSTRILQIPDSCHQPLSVACRTSKKPTNNQSQPLQNHPRTNTNNRDLFTFLFTFFFFFFFFFFFYLFVPGLKRAQKKIRDRFPLGKGVKKNFSKFFGGKIHIFFKIFSICISSSKYRPYFPQSPRFCSALTPRGPRGSNKALLEVIPTLRTQVFPVWDWTFLH